LKYALLFLIATAINGCKKHSGCTEFGSENFDPEAIVDDGSCIHIRDKFIGNFSVNSDCFSNNYNRNITETQDEYMVVISNLADTLGAVDARVYGDNITIELQTVQPSITVEGAGVYSEENAISLSYRIRDSRSGTEVITDCLEWCSKM